MSFSYEPTVVDEDVSLPDRVDDRLAWLQGGLISHATGGTFSGGNATYRLLRAEALELKQDLVPDYVRRSRDLDQFWQFIKSKFSTYAERRVFIYESFGPLLDHAEGRMKNAVLGKRVADRLDNFALGDVAEIWERALARVEQDPQGAITLARTLLETTCKRVLEEAGETYDDAVDLPKLYKQTSELLNLAPSFHTEGVFKSILGSCANIVNSLGTLRNRISDAHGISGQHAISGRPVRPKPRHAALTVNMAGTMASFLAATWQEANMREQSNF